MNNRCKVYHIGLAALVCIMCSFCGCGSTRYLSSPGSDVYLLADYQKAIGHWIEHDEIHDRFISMADSYAVFQAWELRQAYLNTLREEVFPEEQYYSRERDRQIKQFKNGHEFILGLYCYQEDWYHLTGQDPIWQLTLSTSEGISVRPIIIEETPIRSDQLWSYLDQLTHGRKTYRIVFPRSTDSGQLVLGPNTRWFKLNCNSFLGQLSMNWELESVPMNLR